MIQVSNTAAQELQPGKSLNFTRVVSKTGRCQCWNPSLPASVKLCAKGTHDVSFHANITGAAGAVLQIAIAIEGQPIITTAMQAVPAAAGNLVNVSARALVNNCCCDANRISIINSGAVPVTIAPNSSLIIE